MPASDELGAWEPLSVAETRILFEHARFPWWVAGGQALDLFVGHKTRDHSDIDVSMLRIDAPDLHRLLSGWDLQLAHAGVLTPWTIPQVDPPHNSAWCRTTPAEPWSLQVMFEDGTAHTWVYRRRPASVSRGKSLA